MRAKYINPFTDFGFKKIFGEEASKPLLLDFLNALLPEPHKIASLTIKNTDTIWQRVSDRRAIIYINCENKIGEKFSVIFQVVKHNYFSDFIERTIYLSTFPIKEQKESIDWNFSINKVYCISILDFILFTNKKVSDSSNEVRTVKLIDQDGNTYYENLTYIYVEVPKFKKNENELENRLDKWLYFFKNLEDLQSIQEKFNDDILNIAFEKTDTQKFSNEEFDNYQMSLKNYRDLKAVIDTAYSDGEIKRNFEIGRKLMQKGFSVEDISDITGLSSEEIDKL